MNINVNDADRYTPEGSDIIFNIKFLSVKDLDEVEYFEAMAAKPGKISMRTNWQDVFKRCVVSIENCTVNNKAITTAIDYLAIRGSKKLSEIMVDVAMHCKGASEEEIKN
jgi:hypothetical protein